MSLFSEFRAFIDRGNVIDLAIGVVIGTAFTNIVNSLVNDIIMPPIGLVLGRVDFTDLFISLNGQPYESLAAAQAAGAPTLNYGVFINTIINFLIIAFVVFLVVRQANRLQERLELTKQAEAPAEWTCPYCLSSVPLNASRCKFCTSTLEPVSQA